MTKKIAPRSAGKLDEGHDNPTVVSSHSNYSMGRNHHPLAIHRIYQPNPERAAAALVRLLTSSAAPTCDVKQAGADHIREAGK